MRNHILLKIQRLKAEADIPEMRDPDSAGFDLKAASVEISKDGRYIEYGTGIAVEIPPGHIGLLFSKSKSDLTLIDTGYRGEIKIRYRRASRLVRLMQKLVRLRKEYTVGDTIGQLVVIPVPVITLQSVDKLDRSVAESGGSE